MWPAPISPASFASSLKSWACQQPVLVADQPVGADLGRVELDLDLHVLGDRHQRAAHLLDEDLAGLGHRVDVGVVAVALVGERLHLGVLEVAAAEAEDGEEDAALRLLLDQPVELGRRR